jgi:hypothetical protein
MRPQEEGGEGEGGLAVMPRVIAKFAFPRLRRRLPGPSRRHSAKTRIRAVKGAREVIFLLQRADPADVHIMLKLKATCLSKSAGETFCWTISGWLPLPSGVNKDSIPTLDSISNSNS